ncbi:uncharacterized protein ACDP82_019373 [Pangshura tecta]
MSSTTLPDHRELTVMGRGGGNTNAALTRREGPGQGSAPGGRSQDVTENQAQFSGLQRSDSRFAPGCKKVRGRVAMSPGWWLHLVALWTLYGVTGAQASITAHYGEDVTLGCTFNHIPGVKLHRLNITWKMQRAEGAALLVHSYYGDLDLWWGQDEVYRGRTQLYREGIHKGNASLRLRAVRFQDEGSYLCYVTSELRTSTQKISLAVLRESEMASPIVAQLGQNVTLSCPFECGLNLQPLNITWTKEEAEGPDLLVHSYCNGMDTLQRQDAAYKGRTQLHPERFPQGNASLTLERVLSQDEGFYICHVQPELGRFSVRMQVTVEGFVSDRQQLVALCVVLCLVALLLFILCIIVKTRYPSLLRRFGTSQFCSQRNQQQGRDQPESNPLTASESVNPNPFLPPPASSFRETHSNSQPCEEVTTRCPGGSQVMRPGSHGDTLSSSSLDWQPVREHEQQGGAATDVVWEDFAVLSEGEIAELKAAVATNTPPGLASALQEVSEAVKNAKLKVAVVGETGSGKSSFVNATRGLKEHDADAAETGVVGTMVEPKGYAHPEHPNVMLWDLPMNCPLDTFLEQRHVRHYDLFVIVSCGRFTHTDARLVEEIRMLEKTFYFVRSKVDLDVASAQRRNICEESALQTIREDCTSHLGAETDVFLISSWAPDEFDFPRLQRTLAEEFRRHRACALQQALSKSSLPILRKISVVVGGRADMGPNSLFG